MGGSRCTGSVITLLRPQPAACHQVSRAGFFSSLSQAQHIAMLLYIVRQHKRRNKYKHAIQNI